MALLLVKTFNTPHEAHLFKFKLEAVGIKCFLHDENLIGLDPLYNIALGGIKLMIQEEDKDLAIEVLAKDGEQLSDSKSKAPKKRSFLRWITSIFR